MRLVARRGDPARKSITLRPGLTTIGTASDNDVVLADPTVSRHHATLKITGTSSVLTDLNSTNGTFRNGVRIGDPSAIGPGDQLRFGAVTLLLESFASAIDEARPAARSPIGRWFVVLVGLAAATAAVLLALKFQGSEVGGLARPGESTRAISSESIAEPPTPSPEAEDIGPTPWLDVLNRYRTIAGVAPVRSNARLSRGAALHSHYLVINYGNAIRRGISLGPLMHQEDTSKPGYTTDGAAAGLAGDVSEMWHSEGSPQPGWAIADWISVPFHRLSLLDPRLRSVGYGDDCNGGVCVATLNAQTDRAPWTPGTQPVEYPANNSSIADTSLSAEWPDPLASCNGYTRPAGLPLTVQIRPQIKPALSHYTLTLAGTAATIEACGIDANSYTNADPATQNTGREILREYGAVIVVPRHPLAPGDYTVELTAGDQPFRWSFRVIP